jgi:hypothetical protein
MPVWKNCQNRQFIDEGDLADCDVRIDGKEIVVSFKGDDGNPVVYIGKEIGDGHYELRSKDHGTATLHRFPKSHFLEGFWRDGSDEGMWRIVLNRNPDSK